LKKKISSASRTGSPWARLILDLARPAFLQDAVDFEALRLGEVIDVVDDLAVFVHRRQRIGLFGGGAAAGAAHGRDDRLVGVDVARDQEEFHLRARRWGASPFRLEQGRPRVSARCAARPGTGLALLVMTSWMTCKV
jgi:hypothetical protein